MGVTNDARGDGAHFSKAKTGLGYDGQARKR